MTLFRGVLLCFDRRQLRGLLASLLLALTEKRGDDGAGQCEWAMHMRMPVWTRAPPYPRLSAVATLDALVAELAEEPDGAKQPQRARFLENTARAWFLLLALSDVRVRRLLFYENVLHRAAHVRPPKRRDLKRFLPELAEVSEHFVQHVLGLAAAAAENHVGADEAAEGMRTHVAGFVEFAQRWWVIGAHLPPLLPWPRPPEEGHKRPRDTDKNDDDDKIHKRFRSGGEEEEEERTTPM